MTGIPKPTVYRLINLPEAKRWGIERTHNQTQPYTYYVDDGQLVAYQTYMGAREGMNNNQTFDDPNQQKLYEVLNSHIVEFVKSVPNPSAAALQFPNLIVNLNVAEKVAKYDTLKSVDKVALGLVMAFQNISDHALL